MRVGEHTTDKYGDDWVCTGRWKWPEHIDYAMKNCRTGEDGGFREVKTSQL